MSAELLLEHLKYAADLPDAVPLVRRFILDMAVRGKLVSQNPKDEPAAKLLERIAKEKRKLEKEGVIRQGKSLPPIDKKDIPFQIPDGWEWAYFSNIVDFVGGKTPRRNELAYWNSNDYPWVSISDMAHGLEISKTKEHVSSYAKETVMPEISPAGTILMSFKLTIGKISRLTIPAFHNEGIISIYPHLRHIDNYLFIFLPLFSQYGAKKGAIKGMTLNRDSLSKLLISLPPLAEQKRIVAKVDKLMALCDELEKRQNEREESRRRLVTAALYELKSPPESFAKSARFVVSHFADITARPNSIKALRKTILDMAVRGKLVSQNAKDEPAIKLLERIAKEKRKLEKDGIIRQEKSLPPIDEKDIPFQIPNGWVWTQFANIGLINPRNIGDDNMQVSFVPMRLIFSDYGKSHESQIRQWYKIKMGYTHFSEGDVGVAKITPCFENGKSTIFKNLCGGMGSGSTQIYVIRPIYASADYILAFVKSSLFIDRGIPTMTGTAGQKGLPRNYLISALFPLPPLAEQKRIVAKVDKLMALCDKLESSLTATQENRRRLLVSLLRADSLDGKNGANG